MIFDYGFSLIGKSHIAKGLCCQDNHKIKKLDNGWFIAAIADGVGSAENSQVGSKIATETVVKLCEELMPWDFSIINIKSMMRTAYNYAFKRIIREAEKTGNPIESYDTTLSMVIYDGHKIIYGHSGDGAIIGLNTFGDYVEITKPQKGKDGVSVIPLRSGYTQWIIDTYEEELAAVLLVTDGMLDILCHYLLKDHKQSIYTPLASFFMDPIGISDTEIEHTQLKNCFERFIQADDGYNIDEFYSRITEIYINRIPTRWKEIIRIINENNYPIGLMNGVKDDKTVVGLINTEIMVENKDASFYAEPNWDELQERWDRKAYPHLYQVKTCENKPENIENDVLDKHEKEEKSGYIPFKKNYENQRKKIAFNAYGRNVSDRKVKSETIQVTSRKESTENKDGTNNGSMVKHEKPIK